MFLPVIERLDKFRQSFQGEISTVYRHGEIQGLHGLEQLGDALYQFGQIDREAAYAN